MKLGTSLLEKSMKTPYLPNRILRVAALSVLTASSLFADFGWHRDNNAEKFAPLTPKPFNLDKDVAVVVMREGIPRGGGYTYQYPRENPEPFMTDVAAIQGDLSLQVDLIASDYSGAAVCIAGTVDLMPYLEEGVVDFWIKGDQGGEAAIIALLDDGVKSNGESLQVKVNLKSFGEITTDWKHYVIPLKVFGETGVYWDVKNQREVTMPFNWKAFKGWRIEIRKDENTAFRTWVDNIVIRKSGPAYEGPAGYPFRNTL
jgi:hypothetical protein